MRSRGTETMLIDRPTGSIEATIIVSVRFVVPGRAAVDPDQQHAQPLVVPGPRSGWRPVGRVVGRLEDPGERVAEHRPVLVDEHVRDRDEQHDGGQADDTDASRGTPVAACRGTPGPTARRRQPRSRKLIVSSVASTGGETTKAASRVSDCVEYRRTPRSRSDERRDQEHRREAGPPVERLTEPREHRRKTGRGEAAAVDMSGVRPDSAGVHDGRWSSIRWVVGPPGSLPGSGRGDAGRSISLP